MRLLSLALLLHIASATFMPAYIVADFLIEKSKIERELCVQRMVPQGTRTCHGECQLAKRLDRLEHRAQEMPQQLKQLRTGEMILTRGSTAVPLAAGPYRIRWAHLVESVLKGYPHRLRAVPWG